MKEKMDNIDIYNNSAIILNNKTPKNIVSWITILILILITFVIFSFIPFNIYKPYFGYIKLENDNTFFITKLEYSDFPVIKNKKLYINSQEYDYEFIGIENEQLVLKISIDDNLKIDNNMVRVNVLTNRTTLFRIIKNRIKKGFGL